MALTSRQFQWICFECLFLTSACVTITSSGSFENGTKVELTCINQPYSGTQIWRMNTVEVLSCGVTSCSENVSNPGRFSFVNDRSNGVFVFTIDPILFTDDGSVVGCQDGTTEKTFNINVKDKLDSSTNATFLTNHTKVGTTSSAVSFSTNTIYQDVGSISSTKTFIFKVPLFIYLQEKMTQP